MWCGIPLTAIRPRAACELAHNNWCGSFAIETVGPHVLNGPPRAFCRNCFGVTMFELVVFGITLTKLRKF